MFNWGLQEPGDGDSLVTGRVCLVGTRGRGEDYDSEDEDFSDEEEEEEEEVLEVILRLRETESRSREEYFDTVRGFSSSSKTTSTSTGPEPGPSRVRESGNGMAQEVSFRNEDQSRNQPRKSKRRKLDQSNLNPNSNPTETTRSNSISQSTAFRRTTSNPIQNRASPSSFLDVGALATSSSPPFDPSRRQQPASPATFNQPQPSNSQGLDVRPGQTEHLLHLLQAVSEQTKLSNGGGHNGSQQNQAQLVQVLNSLAGALGAQSTPKRTGSNQRNESESMPPPSSLPFASSSTLPQGSTSSLHRNLSCPVSGTAQSRSVPPKVSFTAPSSSQDPVAENCGNDQSEANYQPSSPQDWSFLLSSLDKAKENLPPAPASQGSYVSERSMTTNPINNGNQNADAVICYNCGKADEGDAFTVVTLFKHETVSYPGATVNSTRKETWRRKGNRKGKGKEKEVEEPGAFQVRACKLCGQYRKKYASSRPERLWIKSRSKVTSADTPTSTPRATPDPSTSIGNKKSESSKHAAPVFDWKDGNGNSKIGRGIAAGGLGGKMFREIGLKRSSKAAPNSLKLLCESREVGTPAVNEATSSETLDSSIPSVASTSQLNNKGKVVKRGSYRRPGDPPRAPPARPAVYVPPVKPWSSMLAEPSQLPEPIFDKVTGKRTRPPFKSKPKSSSSSSKGKAVHFGQSSPVRPSISARATFNGFGSNCSPLGRSKASGSNGFMASSPGATLDKFMSECDYDFGSISFPGLGNEVFNLDASLDEQGIGNDTSSSFGSGLPRRSPRKAPSGTLNKSNPYASSNMEMPASPTFSLSRTEGGLSLNRHQPGGPASMGVLTSSVSPMTRSRTRSSNGGFHPAMLSSSLGKRASHSNNKEIGNSSDTSPGSPTPSSNLRSGGSKRSSNKRKNEEDLETPNLDLGLWAWTNQEDDEDDEEGGDKGDDLTQELEASPSSSRRNRKGSKTAQSSELSRGPSSSSRLRASSSHKLTAGRLGSKPQIGKKQENLFNTSNPPGGSPSVFELALQNDEGRSPEKASRPNPITTPKKGTSKGWNNGCTFKHLREESWASAKSPLWGGETPASRTGERPGVGESPSTTRDSASKKSQALVPSPALAPKVQSDPPRVARKPLPATVEDAPSSSCGGSNYDEDEYMDEGPSPAESGLFEGFEDPYGLLAASGIGLDPNSSQPGLNISSDTFREAIELYRSNEFGSQLRDFTQNGGTGVAAHINPNGNQQSFGEIQGAVLRDGQAQIGDSNLHASTSQLPRTPGRSRNTTHSNFISTGLTPGMTPINLASLTQGSNSFPSHFHSSSNASPGVLNSLLNDPSWKELLQTFASPQKSSKNQAQIMSAEEEDELEGNAVASGSGTANDR